MFQVERVISYLKSSVGTHRITDSAYKEILLVGKFIKVDVSFEYQGQMLIKVIGEDDQALLMLIHNLGEITIDKWQDSGLLN